MPYLRSELQDLRDRRRRLGEEVRGLYGKAKTEKREVTDEESARIDTILGDERKLWAQIERMEKADGLLQDIEPRGEGRKSTPTDPELETRGEELEKETRAEARKVGKGPRDTPEYRRLWNDFCQAPNSAAANAIAQRAAEYLLEKRDLQTDNETQAGVLVPPEQFVVELIKNVDDEVLVRKYARKFQVRQAKSLGAPKRTAKMSTWGWGAEIATPSKDTSLAFGKRQLFPRHASGLAIVSKDFMRSSLLPAEQIIREEIARDGGELQENAFLSGSGANGTPLGVFTASVDGISTSRDVSTGNSTTAIGLNGLREAKYSVKPQYWPSLRWMGSRTFHKQCYSLDDGDGRPLLVESVRTGEIDRVLGFPVDINEFAPNTFTTGQYVAILGDWFKGYWIADALDIETQRLDELYALTNQIGFVARLKVDGMPVLEECWARVKLA